MIVSHYNMIISLRWQYCTSKEECRCLPFIFSASEPPLPLSPPLFSIHFLHSKAIGGHARSENSASCQTSRSDTVFPLSPPPSLPPHPPRRLLMDSCLPLLCQKLHPSARPSLLSVSHSCQTEVAGVWKMDPFKLLPKTESGENVRIAEQSRK